MKSYTDLEQSKKLAEILPLESADMFYRNNGIEVKLMWEHNAPKVEYPCWSLAALMNVLPSATLDSSDDHHYRVHCKEMCGSSNGSEAIRDAGKAFRLDRAICRTSGCGR